MDLYRVKSRLVPAVVIAAIAFGAAALMFFGGTQQPPANAQQRPANVPQQPTNSPGIEYVAPNQGAFVPAATIDGWVANFDDAAIRKHAFDL